MDPAENTARRSPLAALTRDVDGRPLGAGARLALWCSLASLAGLGLAFGAYTVSPDLLIDTTGGWWQDGGGFKGWRRWLLSALGPLAAVQVVRRRGSAVEMAGWCFFLTFVWWGPVRMHPPPALALHLVSAATCAALLFAAFTLAWHRGRLFAPSTRRMAGVRELFGALRLTLALFLLAEYTADLHIRLNHPPLLAVVYERTVEDFRTGKVHDASLPTVVTLGSSGANMEREADEPFSVVLEERHRDRFNFVYTMQGGLNTNKLVEKFESLLGEGTRTAEHVRELLPRGVKPDAILWYAGFQDYNSGPGLKLVRKYDPIGATGMAPQLVAAAMKRSSLVTFLLWRYRGEDCMASGARCRELEMLDILGAYAANLDHVIKRAAEQGVTLFVITLAIDKATIHAENWDYVQRVNDHLRGLPAKHLNVRLVDFAAAVAERFPDDQRDSCEPFELGYTQGDCGNQYHLSRKGHALLAETIAPVLEQWRASR